MAKTKSFNPKLRLLNFNASETTSQPVKSLEEQIREGEVKLLKKIEIDLAFPGEYILEAETLESQRKLYERWRPAFS